MDQEICAIKFSTEEQLLMILLCLIHKGNNVQDHKLAVQEQIFKIQ